MSSPLFNRKAALEESLRVRVRQAAEEAYAFRELFGRVADACGLSTEASSKDLLSAIQGLDVTRLTAELAHQAAQIDRQRDEMISLQAERDHFLERLDTIAHAFEEVEAIPTPTRSDRLRELRSLQVQP